MLLASPAKGAGQAGRSGAIPVRDGVPGASVHTLRKKCTGPKLLTLRDRMRPEEVGAKFYRQSEMFRSGINVPRFFCLTAAFYEAVFAPLAPAVAALLDASDSERPEMLQNASARIRDLFTRVKLGESDRQLVLDGFDRIFPDGGLVSVRASMIGFKGEESEDSITNPFAGMSESFLYVRRQDLLEKLLQAMASGFQAESILYRYKQAMNLMGFSVAVGIQQMVFGKRSFVLFTCDPNTAARETVIIAGHGIGEGVVQEKVPVDHFFFNPMTEAIRRRVVVKDRMLNLAPQGYGLSESVVPESLRAAPCLEDHEICGLARLGARIEKIFRGAQDIEGAITEDGAVHILQSRPVSMDTRRQRVWTTANVTESFPDVTTPLTYSLARYFYRVIFYDCYRMLGIGARDLHDQYEPLDRMIGFLGGRIYYCLTSFYQLHQQSPLFPLFRTHWEKMMGFQSSYEIGAENIFHRAAQRFRAMFRLSKAIGVIAWRYTTHQRDIRRFHHWWEELIASRRGRSYAQEDPILAMADFHEVWRQVGNRWGITLMNDTYLPVLHGWTQALAKKWGLSESLIAGLLCGDENLTSVDIILSAVRLAEDVRRDPLLARMFRTSTPEELWRAVESNSLPLEFCASVRDHLHRYGDRGFQELKMEQPSLRHTPWVFMRIIHSYVDREMTVDSYRAKERQLRAAAEVQLYTALSGHPLRKALLRKLLETLRRLIQNRENSRYCRSELFSHCKSIFCGIGHYLVREGKLRSVDDVYYLTMDDVFGYVDGTGVTEDLQALADLRRAEFCSNKLRETAVQITSAGPVRQNNLFVPPAKIGNGRLLRGLGSSAGTVTGVARVVLDPNLPVQLGENGILIARETDPGWLFLMLSSKAIVVERGSMLSHTAITGRKFGIPTVVSVPEATLRIQDGAWISVDGASGVVTILDGEE